MNRWPRFFTILSLLFVLSHSQTHLSGTLQEMELTSEMSPYFIENELTVPEEVTLTIKAGAVLLFKSFTGINIYGNLIVEGTDEQPVVFTSINDATYYKKTDQLPNSFDWNGLYVDETAGAIKLRNFKLMYSVYGIKSQKDDIIIQNGTFKQNGQFHFTINDNIHYVQDNLSYSYRSKEVPKKSSPAPALAEKEKEPKPQKAKKEKRKKKKRSRAQIITAISSAVIGVGCGAGSAYFWSAKTDYHEKYLAANDQVQINKYHEQENTAFTRAGLLTGTSGVFVPAAVFLFLFQPPAKKQAQIFIRPSIAKSGGGLTFSMRF